MTTPAHYNIVRSIGVATSKITATLQSANLGPELRTRLIMLNSLLTRLIPRHHMKLSKVKNINNTLKKLKTTDINAVIRLTTTIQETLNIRPFPMRNVFEMLFD
jgi:DNA replicative helicase MCM subunit Mcm2 (Cdc46/Mcm family)